MSQAVQSVIKSAVTIQRMHPYVFRRAMGHILPKIGFFLKQSHVDPDKLSEPTVPDVASVTEDPGCLEVSSPIANAGYTTLHVMQKFQHAAASWPIQLVLWLQMLLFLELTAFAILQLTSLHLQPLCK